MASIANDGNGRKRIQFVAGDGSRKTIRMGNATMKQAEKFKANIEALVTAARTGALDDKVEEWLSALPDGMHGRIAAVGLAKPRSRQAVTLGKFLDDYFANLDVKPGTETAYAHTRRNLEDFFDKAKPIRAIEQMDADLWRQHLKAEGLSDATISRRVVTARSIFNLAVRWKLRRDNPFADIKAGPQRNRARMAFISREDARKVLNACPDAQWRLLFALSRYGGLRCPSEHLALKWGDVKWGDATEPGTIRVHSPKTEHHAGGESRLMPLFPELRPYLQAVYDEADPGTEYVITRYRETNVNLRSQLQRIIERAGVKPWPKLFHNLRATRQTELAEVYPQHVVCAWIGNSEKVADEHYLQVTGAHFADAAREMPRPAESAAQIEAQYPAEWDGNTQKSGDDADGKSPELQRDTVGCQAVQSGGWAREDSNF